MLLIGFYYLTTIIVSVVSDGRIVGGENAEIETYPYQVSLQYNGKHICGGSIISASYALTAGHCYKATLALVTVRAGSAYHGRGGVVRQIEQFVQHEHFHVVGEGDTPVNDLAMIKLKEALVFSHSIQPIGLFERGEESAPGSNATVTGWGYLDESTHELPEQLQVVGLPIVDKVSCDLAYKELGGLPDNAQICAGYLGKGGKDACLGDSGGPLTINGRLAGLVSWAEGCARAQYMGVYVEIAQFRDWIDERAQLS